VIEHIYTKDHFYWVFEYIESGSIAEVIKKFGILPENLASNYIRQALVGLQYLHEHNIVHRDIKGSNILLSKEGVVILGDFGLAVRADDKQTPKVVGTPYWSIVYM
jgi:cell division control protein CDC15